MHFYPEELIKSISHKAQQFRIQVLKMVYEAQTGHIGGAFSCAEIIAALFNYYLNIDPLNPAWPKRDRLLFSKGHACAMLYTAMADKGFFPQDELRTFRKFNSRLQGHPDRLKLPGIEISAGPLGHGIAIGVGIALGVRKHYGEKLPNLNDPINRSSLPKVYIILGDGEINAGIIWEGAMIASKFGLGNIIAILDNNGVQQTGSTTHVMPTEPIIEKWKSFGWHTQEIHGHNIREILYSLDRANEIYNRPSIIIARTTKGKGVSFMEDNPIWHGTPPNEEQYKIALKELEEGLRQWQN